MANDQDLTQLSATFPEAPSTVISRESLVVWLYDLFSPERKILVVQGLDGSGRTTLLAQFASKYATRCFSYFIRDDHWLRDPQTFLREMCSQMQSVVMGLREDLDRLSYEQLGSLFSKLYIAVAKKGRREETPYFFVIDGLEWGEGETGQASILSLLPKELVGGIYMLASSYTKHQLGFAHHPVPIQPFSPSDTEDYLKQVGVQSKDNVLTIYKISGGMPGYLDQVRREISAGRNIDDIIRDLPNGFAGFLERDWQRREPRADTEYHFLALLAFSKSPLKAYELSDIIQADIEHVQNFIENESFIQSSSITEQLTFASDGHKQFVSERLLDYRSTTESLLIEYYKKDIYSEHSLFNLPLLYEQHYSDLQNLFNSEYIARAFTENHDLYLLRRGIDLLKELAYRNSDWQKIARYSLMSSVLQAIGWRSVEQIEIEALLGVGKEQESLELAYNSILLEDRLQLLVTNAKILKEKQSPLLENLVDTISDIVQQITETDVLRSKILDIAPDLFYVHPQSAIDLVDKVLGNVGDGRTVDFVLALIALNSKKADAESRDNLRLKIKDESLRDFVRAISGRMIDMPAETIVAEANALSDTSGKLLMLRAWCNVNRDKPDAITVVDQALDIITTGDYPISMRLLRQFAEPLTTTETDRLEQIIARFDILKGTAIKHPRQEAVRLELILASAERRFSVDKAHERLFYLYYEEIATISDLDVLCYCMGRILVSLPDIDPNDSLGLCEEVIRSLPAHFGELLQGSAEQYEVAKRFIGILTDYDYSLALQYAEQLNRSERRDEAYSEVLGIYAEQHPTSLDLNFVHDVLNRIESHDERADALVRFIEELAHSYSLSNFDQLLSLLPYIDNLDDAISIARSYAHLCRIAVAANLPDKAREFFDRIRSEWGRVDRLWDRVHIGFQLVSILSEADQEHAQTFLQLVRDTKRQSPLSEGMVAELYINSLTLAIRTYADIAKQPESSGELNRLLQHIAYIPSPSVRCFLYADLALRLSLANREHESQQIVQDNVLADWEYIHNFGDRATYLAVSAQIAPCLYQYSPVYFESLLSQFPTSYRDLAATRVFRYVVTRRPATDPVDFTDGNFNVTYPQAVEACKMLNYVQNDDTFYHVMSALIDKILLHDPTKASREKCVLSERQALPIARQLVEMINNKLPDPKGIQHNGYRISAMAALARLREVAAVRADKNWVALIPSWDTLISEAEAIPNLADKALVLASIGEEVFKVDQPLGSTLIGKAQTLVYQIPNVIDRTNRLNQIGQAWKKVRDESAAKFLWNEAIKVIHASDWEEGRDELIGKILENLHSIDPELASSLTSTLDRPVVTHQFEQYAASINLHRHPNKLPASVRPEHLSDAAHEMLESICSNKGTTVPETVVQEWLHRAGSAVFRDLHTILSWSIENSLQTTTKISHSSLRTIFDGQLAGLEIISSIGGELLGDKNVPTWFTTHLPEGLRLFPTGSRQEATEFLTDWLYHNCVNYLKIYDPYFSPSEMWIIRAVAIDIRVTICTTWKAQKVAPGSEEVIQRFRDAWSNESDQAPPETIIYVLGDEKQGESPMHDRFYITDFRKGLSIGTSGSGLGEKGTHIREMSPNEVEAEESNTIDRLMLNPPQTFKGNRLIRKVIQL